MKILIVGGGGREHAIAVAVAESPKADKIYCAPGNAGIAEVAECVPIGVDEFDRIASFAKEKEVDLVIVGPDDPLAAGLVDVLEAAGLRVFWVFLVPGDGDRGFPGPVGRAARGAMTVAFGAAILLAGSGFLEGFVTPSDLPDSVKIVLGVLLTGAAWAYILILGRMAERAGGSDDVGTDAGYYQPGRRLSAGAQACA